MSGKISDGKYLVNALWRKIEFDPKTAALSAPISENVRGTFKLWMKTVVAPQAMKHWPGLRMSDVHSLLSYNLQAFISNQPGKYYQIDK